jgi:hypothetical protein
MPRSFWIPRLNRLLRRRAGWRITGPFRGITGYDKVVRSVVPRLRSRGIAVDLRELGNWTATHLGEALPRDLLRPERRRFPDLHLHFCLPTQVIPSPRCRNINYSMFEATRIPATWAQAARRHDLILVPTESSRQSWLAGGVPAEKVRLCPQGADCEVFSPLAPPLSLRTPEGRPVADFRHRFLNVAEAIDRKNLLGLLRVWLTTTTARDDAILLLKAGFYNAQNRMGFEEGRQRLEAETGRKFNAAAPVLVLKEQLAEAEMPRLYASATHYWSMSRGEGFDLPMIEAAATDLRLIAPWHTAYRHYLSPEIAFLIPAREVEVSIPNDPPLAGLFRGLNWWEPDEAAAAATLRGILDGRVAEKKSARAALAPSCTWDRMVEHLVREIGAE